MFITGLRLPSESSNASVTVLLYVCVSTLMRSLKVLADALNSRFPPNLEAKIEQILSTQVTNGIIPEYWDGQTANRVVQSIKTILT